MSDLAKNTPFEEIARRGAIVYENIKSNYEPQENGKFLAIEVESQKKYLGVDAAEALESARTENPGKLFYVVKVGFSSAETLAHSILRGA